MGWHSGLAEPLRARTACSQYFGDKTGVAGFDDLAALGFDLELDSSK